MSSTTDQVIAAINADPAASALVWAARYRGNANAATGIPQPTAAPVHLSDFLWAPQVGDPLQPTGFQIPRVPYQQYILRICKVCDGSKTGFFVYAQEHAREWVGPLVALETANRLLKNYGTDPTTTSYVDNLDIFIDPSVNTDGGNYSMLQGGASGQRRTMTRFCGPNNPAAPLGDVGSTSFDPAARGSWGIDDNRGFSVGSLFDGFEGASSSCTSDTYAGPAELSQPEDKNEVALEAQFPNIRFSMNIHTSGGYFMWSPASYKTVNREALPYPSKGWQEEFWAAARKTVTAIKNYRGTVVTPDRTGSVVDVLYSAAGNSSDEAWYNKNIIAYDFECGVRLFSPTSTSNNGGDPGFTPNFAAEGRAEGQEFADGMYGLMSSALEYQNDTTPPVDAPSVPSGTISETSVSLVFNESEPSDIYYTTDGSTPTTSSTQYQFSGFREQEGATLTFTHTTTLKWFAVDPKGNTSEVRSATFYVIPPGTPSYSSRPQAMGDQKVAPGATLAAGYDFTIPGKHPATDVLFVGGQVTFQATCVKGPGGGTITVPLPDQAYSVAQDEKGWFPTKDKISDDVFQASTTIPDLCAGGLVRLGEGVFSARILATTTPVTLTVRWHYDADAHPGGWSDTFSVSPDQSS